MKPVYEVDIRSRLNGDSLECIHSGEDYDIAFDIADTYNRNNIEDYNEELGLDEYNDGSDGTFTSVFICETEEDVHGLGKFERT